MPFFSISRDSLEVLTQNYRLPGVMPRPVPPGRGDAAAPDDPSFAVVDQFIRIVPFHNIEHTGQPHARQYIVRTVSDLFEPEFTARPGGTPWSPGSTTAAGQELEAAVTRFKELGTIVRTDVLMTDQERGENVFAVQIGLAEIGVVRALSEAVFHSRPASDDQAEFAGLPFFLPPGSPNDVAFDPGVGLIGGMSEIVERVAPSDGDFGARADVLVMSSRVWWRLLKALEDKGVTPDFYYCPWTGRVEFHFHGVPVVRGRVPEPASPTPTTVAWALKLLGPTGIKILHKGGDSAKFGVRTEPVTTMTGFDASGEASSTTRGVHVFGVYSLNVPEPNSIARLNGIPSGKPTATP